MNHLSSSSHKNLPRQFLYHHYYETQTHQKPFYQSILYQQSPRQLHTNFSTQKSLAYREIHNTNQSQGFRITSKGQNVRKNLFKQMEVNAKEIKNPIEKCNQETTEPLCKQLIKPKISFSYKRLDNRQLSQVIQIPQSCQSCCTQMIDQNIQKILVQEFALTHNKRTKKQKNLKICSNEVSYSLIPQSSQKKIKKYSFFKEKATSSSKKIFNGSQSLNLLKNQKAVKNKDSKVASTEATRSFQTENCLSDHAFQIFENSNGAPSTNSIQKVKSPLIEKIQPSKMLKETIILSKYDFGGLLKHESASQKKGNSKKQRNLQFNRWKSNVKNLFGQSDDLKISIHCGPDIRINNQKCQVLRGFGREIAQSRFAEFENFQ